MPHLSEMTEPLRRLEDKNMEFQWLLQHALATNTIKKYLTKAPVAENRRRSLCQRAAYIPDNDGLPVFEVVEIHRKTAQAVITQFKM